MSYSVRIIEIKSIFLTNIIIFLTSNKALLISNIVFLTNNGAFLTSNIVFLTSNEALLISNNLFCVKNIRFRIQQGLSIQYNSSMHYTFFSCFTGTSTLAISVGATLPENILA